MNDKINRIKKYIKLLNEARKAYYQDSNEIMSNKQYDELYDELEQLEKETGIIYNISPTQNVGYEIKDKLKKVKHPELMLSLAKTKDPNELVKFLGNKDGILSWKLDGLTLITEYDNGELIKAVTRGNGEIGTDVLHIAKTIVNLPKNIAYKGRLIVRGECIVTYSDFKEINVDNQYQNPRNLASGTLMLLDANIAKNRNLKWIAFNLVYAGKDFDNSFENQFKWLDSLGFDTVEYKRVNKNNLLKTIELFSNNINDYNNPSDGLVLVFDDLKYRDSLGNTIHNPLGWYAFKWKDDIVETTLRNIEFNMGRTGVLTPVAVFDSIEIESTSVSRASIHNLNILKSLQLGIGDKINVYKANKIIPQIYDNLTRSNTFKIPTKCPYCDSDTRIVKTEGGEFLYCTNDKCPSKRVAQFSHFVSMDAMNIIGLSDKSIEKFINLGFLKELPDIYKLDQYKNQIINIEGFGIKSYNKLVGSIETSKKASLANFIYALGISQVGKSTAKDLVGKYKYIEDFKYASFQDLITIKDIGNVVAYNISQWLQDEKNVELLNELLNYITFIENDNIIDTTEIQDNPVKGCKIYCTGTFASYKKKELKNIIEKLGGTFANGYAKSLDMLIVGSIKGSSKEAKAKDDGVKIVGEDEFLKMIGGK